MGVFGASLSTLLEPSAAQLRIGPLVAARVIAGIGKGVLVPAKFALQASWVLVHERSVLVAITGQGAMFGLLLAMSLTGAIYKNLRWEYIYGSVGCIWIVCWMWYIHNSPEKHPYITQEELKYIFEHCLSGKRESQSGLWTAALYVAQSITMIICAILADNIRSRKCMSITNIQKLFQSVGNTDMFVSALLGSAACFVALAHVECNYFSVIFLLIIETSLYGFTSGGDGPMAADIAPDFVDLTSDNCNNTKQASMQQWRKVFCLVGGINVAGTLLFVLFSTAEPEPRAVESVNLQALDKVLSDLRRTGEASKKLSMEYYTDSKRSIEEAQYGILH
ncbi:sialin-like [Limulus polyphemus]|uniref:Sialin-like n=1 Tax=Limulus polyphemus TaxID=6850 RepID=A0ABM1B3C0_LIMPO|nr:sialin-like [Limulus polyphemus]